MNLDTNLDPIEVAHFDRMDWWDPKGPMRTLHAINPLRLHYIMEAQPLHGAAVLDVGCGGGILSEAMAEQGAHVTGVDLSGNALRQARAHLPEELSVTYLQQDTHAFAREHPGAFDLVVCMELLEHVPDAEALLEDCVHALKPGGSLVVSTINRTPLAFLLLILGAEHLLELLPIGTHRYDRFIRPSELARAARKLGLAIEHIQGTDYDPIVHRAAYTPATHANYMMRLRRI